MFGSMQAQTCAEFTDRESYAVRACNHPCGERVVELDLARYGSRSHYFQLDDALGLIAALQDAVAEIRKP